MASLEDFVCSKCGRKVFAIKSSRGWCSQCEIGEQINSKKQYLASLKVLTIEERLLLIEDKLYDLKELVEKIDAATSIYTTKF